MNSQISMRSAEHLASRRCSSLICAQLLGRFVAISASASFLALGHYAAMPENATFAAEHPLS
jgi:hypothetical protein